MLAALHGAPAVADAREPRPLPSEVVSTAPGIKPLGRGRHTWWGIAVYDATLWVVGSSWSPSRPHALDVEPSRKVATGTLVNTAISEMRDLKLGDEERMRSWQRELEQAIPSVQPGDQVVIFCPDTHRTLVYFNSRVYHEVDDPTLCPAIMNVWLHPQAKNSQVRKSLLGH
jgi:hypothetical protein